MKKLLMALTLATLATSSAFAKTQHSQSPAAADPYTVIVNGQVVGRDPDPNVRLELMRDPGLPAS